MGLSRLLLIIAVAMAVTPLVATQIRPPATIRELEKSFVVAMVSLGIGMAVVSIRHDFDMFLVVHMAYLVAVVSVPCLLLGWWITALIRGRRTLLVRIGCVVGALIAGLGVWGTHIEPNWLEIDRAALTAPVELPLRVGVLADIQTPNVGKHEWNAVDTLLAEQPDLVLIAGDIFQGPPDVIAAASPDFVALLSALVDNVQLVAVVSGDSDNSQALVQIVEAAGALYLDDRIVDVTVNGQNVRLAGVSVFSNERRLATIAQLGEPTDSLTLLLAHRPDVVFDLPLGTHADLIVSGHTHGGQIALPVVGPLVTFSNVPRSVAAGGLGVVDDYPVYVSTGVGLERVSAPQVRFGVRPSIGVIDLVPAG